MGHTTARTLFIPSVRRGNGSGHLRRCVSLARRMGPESRVWAYPGAEDEVWTTEELAERFPGTADLWITDPSPGWDLVVVDRRSCGLGETRLFGTFGPVVYLDEGGEYRDRAVALIDTLPFPGGPANCASTGYLDLPERRRTDWPLRIDTVLVAFGGEDAQALGPPVARRLRELHPEWRVTLLRGPLNGQTVPEDIDLLDAPSDLSERLADYDLVVGGFGLTTFEALHARVPVVVVPQSPYHRDLAQRAGIPVVPSEFVNLPPIEGLVASAQDAAPRANESLEGVLAVMSPQVPGCPVCGAIGQAELRESDRTFFTCERCGMTYQKRLVPQGLDYGPDYFFDQYRAQYGKTYLEDFDQIRRLAASRLGVLETLSPGRMKILDVGCAYGAFLAEAETHGHSVAGLDVSEAAIDHVRTKLGLPGYVGSFPSGIPEIPP